MSEEIIDLELERRIRDRAEGLKEDLASALDLMVRVARGEQTAEEMGRWISLNYPALRGLLPEHLRVRP